VRQHFPFEDGQAALPSDADATNTHKNARTWV
jgi:hypothetical protein